MDPVRSRGKSRGKSLVQSQPIGPPANPRNVPGVPRPQVPRPQVPRPQVPRPQPRRPQVSEAARSQSSSSLQVQQVTSKLGAKSLDQTPIGRGKILNRHSIVEHYRAPRPESSKSNVGKQGSLGQPLELTTNYFPIKSYAKWTLYQYHVDFSPEENTINLQRYLLSIHKNFLGAYLFEGTILFSCTKYKSDKFELISKRKSDGAIITITVTFTTFVEPGDDANTQIFNVLLRSCLRYMELKLVGRHFYDPLAKIHMQNLRLQLWPGYETSVGLFDSGLLLRTQITTKIMRDDTVYDVFQEYLKERRNDSSWFDKFQAAIIGTVVLTAYNNLSYRIDDIDKVSTIDSTFKKKDGTSISYKDYYFQKWNIRIKYCKQPLLISKKKNQLLTRSGDETDIIYLIPELCIMTGLSNSMRNNVKAMKQIADNTMVNPHERIVRYNNFMSRLLSTPKAVESLKKWNLGLGRELVKVQGRVLPNEQIACNSSIYTSNNGDWTKHLYRNPMYTSADVKYWVIVTPQEFLSDTQNFIKALKTVSDKMSFYLTKPLVRPLQKFYSRNYISELETVINELDPSFIICIIPHYRSDIYCSIKRFLCVSRAVPSQIVLHRNIEKLNLSVVSKIAVQINTKIGGVPWMVKNPRKNMLVMGFDVFHDKQNSNKSYGALVANMNDEQTVYYSCVQEHQNGEELSNFFSTNMTKALLTYRSKNNMLPSSILIYRDGVGDNQLSYVHKVELACVKKACKEFYKDTKLQLAFIVVKKCISTRFFTNLEGAQNPPPGTVVDSIITDPTMYDFYLISQKTNTGTVKPVHYNVIEDTLSNWSPDKMQLLTYKYTHMYFNWSGTVKAPALCQYANKLAFLTGQVLQSTPNTGLNELLYFL